MQETSSRKTGVLLTYLYIIINMLISLLYTPLLIRKLGQSEYGLYSLVSNIIGYLTILDLGFGNAIIVYTAKFRAQKEYDKEKKLHSMFFIVFCVIGAIAVMLGLVLFFKCNSLFGKTMTLIEINKMKTMLLILTFNLAITFPFSIFNSIIAAYEKFTFQKIVSIISIILKPLIMIPLLFLGYKAITMSIIITLVNIMVLLSNYTYCKRKLNVNIEYNGFDKKIFNVVLGYSIWIFIGVIVDKINWNIDNFILGIVSGTAAISIYSVASTINSLFIQLSTAVSNVLLPKMSKMISNNVDNNVLTKEMIKVGRIQFYIIFLIVSGFVLFGKEFIMWWAGKEYFKAYYCLLLLAIPISIPLIQNLGISIRQAMNKNKIPSIINIIVAIFNFIITIFLSKRYQEIGAAIGTGGGILLSIILINIYYHKVIKINMIEFWKNIIILLIPFMFNFLVFLIILKFIIKISIIYQFFAFIIIYILIYSIICWIIGFNSYEKQMIKDFLNKILKSRRKVDGLDNK